MKEIIYLETNLMNSMLAQLDEGLINSFSLEQSNQESETEGQQTIRGKNAGVRGRLKLSTGFLPGGSATLDGSSGNSASESEHESRTFLEGQKDILNKAFHDHSLEVLTQKLNEGNFLCNGENVAEGDLLLGNSSYRFYDFGLLSRAMEFKSIKEIMLGDINKYGLDYEAAKKLITKKNPNAKDREMMESAKLVVQTHDGINPTIDLFKLLNTFGTFASNLLVDLTVIKMENKIGLLKKEYLRESTEALSLRTDKSRKVKFLVRIIGKKEVVYNGFNLPNLQGQDIDMVPNMMLDIILGSFEIVKKGDLIVTPIAIYYE